MHRGFHLSAPARSTWIQVNARTSQRSACRPLGNKRRPSVATANQMISRLVLALLVAQAGALWWAVEQPRGSAMERHPRPRP
eukprot:2941449-Alexandrium_andersonii.AAC.1